MEKVLDYIFNFAIINPFAITLLVVLLCFIFKKQISGYIEKKFKLKTEKKIENLLETMAVKREVLDFAIELIVNDQELFYSNIKEVIDNNRNEHQPLVFDLSRVRTINDLAREGLRDALKEAINKDDSSILIVFAVENCSKLYNEITEHIFSKNSNSVKVKRDTRAGERIEIGVFEFSQKED